MGMDLTDTQWEIVEPLFEPKRRAMPNVPSYFRDPHGVWKEKPITELPSAGIEENTGHEA